VRTGHALTFPSFFLYACARGHVRTHAASLIYRARVYKKKECFSREGARVLSGGPSGRWRARPEPDHDRTDEDRLVLDDEDVLVPDTRTVSSLKAP